ncbi:hypothetical protein [Amycolatopsis sp. NPDC054798]
MTGLAWILVPSLTPAAVMALTLVMQRWEEVVLPADRPGSARETALGSDGVEGLLFPGLPGVRAPGPQR